jgi:hypothetical protein
MKARAFSLAAACLLAITSWSAAQDVDREAESLGAVLVGTVTILGTQRPLSMAVVRLLGQDVSTVTDSMGAFRFSGLQPGQDTLQVHYLSYDRYDSEKIPVQLEAGRPVVLKVVAAYAAVVMEELTVKINRTIGERRKAYFERRRKMGDGDFISREEIDQRNAIWMAQLFWRGLRTRVQGKEVLIRGRGGMRGFCKPVIYVNGAKRPLAKIDDFSPWNIEAIEVYRSPIGPAQFLDGFNVCGSIVLWTRRGGG